MKPSNIHGNIQIIDNISLSLLNWDSPPNQNETDISFYDISLSRNHSDESDGTGTSLKSIHVAASRQTQSYKYAVSNSGNSTRASITAVDICGQRSDASEFQLNDILVTDGNITDTELNDHHQQTIDILAGVLAFAFAIIIALLIVFIPVVIYQCIVIQREAEKYRRSYTMNNLV